jgi:hypothetical protein
MLRLYPGVAIILYQIRLLSYGLGTAVAQEHPPKSPFKGGLSGTCLLSAVQQTAILRRDLVLL